MTRRDIKVVIAELYKQALVDANDLDPRSYAEALFENRNEDEIARDAEEDMTLAQYVDACEQHAAILDNRNYAGTI